MIEDFWLLVLLISLDKNFSLAKKNNSMLCSSLRHAFASYWMCELENKVFNNFLNDIFSDTLRTITSKINVTPTGVRLSENIYVLQHSLMKLDRSNKFDLCYYE